MVAEHGCGLHVPPGNGQGVRRLHEDRALLTHLRAASRAAAEKDFSRLITVPRYLGFLQGWFRWTEVARRR
ncbi:MAG TPA: hypothetical protein VNA25_15065 [Phycisphaerae bacterium]|nr:hypothetical protein [Phycisphaerae bacterium]